MCMILHKMFFVTFQVLLQLRKFQTAEEQLPFHFGDLDKCLHVSVFECELRGV